MTRGKSTFILWKYLTRNLNIFALGMWSTELFIFSVQNGGCQFNSFTSLVTRGHFDVSV